MRKRTAKYRIYTITAWCGLGLFAANTFAQWGTNAPLCPEGPCAPSRKSWGYYPTHWRRWPNALYPDMIKPPPQPGGDQLPPGQTELPDPGSEADVKTPSPSRDAAQAPRTNGAAQEKPQRFEPEPTPAMPLETSPNELPTPRSVPETAPPEEPLFGPPKSNKQSAVPDQRTGPQFAPAPQFAPRAKSTESFTTLQGTRENKSSRVSWTEPKAVSASKELRTTSSEYRRSQSPDDEPDLITPSLSTRPLDKANARPQSDLDASGNPLREEVAAKAVLPAALMEADQPASSRTMVNAAATPSRNPLRRN